MAERSPELQAAIEAARSAISACEVSPPAGLLSSRRMAAEVRAALDGLEVALVKATGGTAGCFDAGETAVLDHLVAAWNAFTSLPPQHGDDVHEFRAHIHALQHLIMARPARRTSPERLRIWTP